MTAEADGQMRRTHRRQRIAIALISAAVFAPILQSGPFMVDDLRVMVTSQELVAAVRNHEDGALLNLLRCPWDVELGRIRPLYFPYTCTLFLLFGKNFFLRHAVDLAIWVVLNQLIYSLTRKLSNSPRAPLLAPLLFMFSWFAGGAPMQTQIQEPLLVLFVLTSCLALKKAEEYATATPARKGRAWVQCGLAFVGMLGALAMKETGIALLPALAVVSLLALLQRRKPLLALHGVFLTLTVLAGTVFSIAVTYMLAHSEGHTSGYGGVDFANVLQQGLWWLDRFFASYGPLFMVGLVALAVRVQAQCRSSGLTDELRWRIGLVTLLVAATVIVLPWPGAYARLILPGVAGISIVLASELADTWNQFAPCPGHPPPDKRGPVGKRFWIAVLAVWITPAVTYPIIPLVLAIKTIAMGCAIILGAIFMRRQAESIRRFGAIADPDRKTIRIVIGASVAMFVILAPFMYYTRVVTRSPITFGAHREVIDFLAKNTPRSGRVVVNSYPANADALGLRLKYFDNRGDIRVVPVVPHPGAIPPSATVFTFSRVMLLHPAELTRRIAHQSRETHTFRHSAIWFNTNWFQPSRLSLWAIGLSDPGTLPRPFQWNGFYRRIDTVWTVLSPAAKPQAAPANE